MRFIKKRRERVYKLKFATAGASAADGSERRQCAAQGGRWHGPCAPERAFGMEVRIGNGRGRRGAGFSRLVPVRPVALARAGEATLLSFLQPALAGLCLRLKL